VALESIPPLKYAATSTSALKRILTASEIKALFQQKNIGRELCPESLAQVYTYWTTITPNTPFKDIYELPPGHSHSVTLG